MGLIFRVILQNKEHYLEVSEIFNKLSAGQINNETQVFNLEKRAWVKYEQYQQLLDLVQIEKQNHNAPPNEKNTSSQKDDLSNSPGKNSRPINNYNDEISKLNSIISDLKTKGKKAVASRDKWKERAEVAEENLKNYIYTDMKFKQVKKSFSKMYHPDCLSDNGFEKLIKQEIFKEFWQVIESIEKNEP